MTPHEIQAGFAIVLHGVGMAATAQHTEAFSAQCFVFIHRMERDFLDYPRAHSLIATANFGVRNLCFIGIGGQQDLVPFLLQTDREAKSRIILGSSEESHNAYAK